MKKLLSSILAAVMIICSLFCFSSCARPKLDLDDAKDNFEDEEYYVNYVDKDAGTGMDERLTAYKDDDSLTIIKFKKASTAKLYYQNLKLQRDNEIETLQLEIKTNKHLLNKYEKDLSSDEIDDLEDEIKDIEKELEEYKKEYVIGRSGKTVWFGTKDAIEDSKG